MVDDSRNDMCKWTWREALLCLSILLISTALLKFILLKVYPPFINSFVRATEFPSFLVLAILFILAVVPHLISGGISLGMVYFFAVVKHKERISALGLSRVNLWKNIVIGVVVGAALVIVYKVIFIIEGGTKELGLMQINKHWFVVLYAVVFEGFLASFRQELFFVSFLYAAFKKQFGWFGALSVTVFCFAFVHSPIPTHWSIKYFIHICLSVLLFEKRKSIIPAIMMHAVHNIFI